MRQITLLFSIIFSAIIFQACSNKIVRIACVGDSITEGDGLADRANEAYPAILSQELDGSFKVINLGQSGATLLKHGDWPYWKKIAYKNTLAINPDRIIILLGANDSKPQNIPAYPGEFELNLEELVENYKNLPSRPKVYLCTPMPVFENRFNISDSVLVAEVIPAIKKVAKAQNCTIIDLHSIISGRRDILSDGVHPSKDGAIDIAKYIAGYIKK